MKSIHIRIALTALLQAAVMLPQLARADYASTVTADSPAAYWRFNDSTTRNLLNHNSGPLGSSADASNDLAFVTGGIVRTMPGAIAGDPDLAEFFDYTTRTEIPYNAALNPPITTPFTLECWIYPVSDQASTGMGVLCNRYTQGPTRQGWVMYQRAADFNHNTNSGPGVGWELRMYNNQDTSGHLDVTSQVPFTFGQWQHVAVVYDPVQITNATITMYINGVAANTNIWDSPDGVTPGYYPCQDTNDAQPNGPPAMSLGGYNNANGGTDGFENPWVGGLDEFAFYPVKLTSAQLLSHYQAGTNAHRAQPYSATVLGDGATAYLRLDERAPSVDAEENYGQDRSLDIATNLSEVGHPGSSPIANEPFGGSVAFHWRNGSGTADIPYNVDNNPPASVPFTLEVWLRPTSDRISPGAAPINNRFTSSGNRTGWVIFQRAPDASYAGYTPDYEGTGWNFRMYDGAGSSSEDLLTSYDWIPNVWQHFVVTWQPQTDDGDPGNGGDQWQGILTGYIDGVAVATNSSALYCGNMSPTEDASMPADMAIGSYNIASGDGLGANPYEGDVAQMAFYNGYNLSPAQIAAHYQAATDPNYGTNYESLVFNAAGDTFLATNGYPITEGITIPKAYLPLNDPAYLLATNNGSVGGVANGNLLNTTNNVNGPRPPTYAGFDAGNTALPFDGATAWASFNDPSAMQISGQITLEAWVLPGATQGQLARIVTHGPETLSSYLGTFGNYQYGVFTNSVTNSTDVSLSINDAGTIYSVGVDIFNDDASGTNTIAATFPVPAGDLGGTNWVYLAGTYDGAKWNLYRNGALVATTNSPIGALNVTNGDWAVGATGEGWGDFFTGSIDEVAVYHTALSASQISAHYTAAHSSFSSAPITIARGAGENVIITWPSGSILQQAASVTGPWTDVPGSPSSPLTVTATGTAFYRWRQ